MTALELLDIAIYYARYVVIGCAGVAGVVCVGDWLVRTRRLSPFSAVARFFRGTVDPLLAPVERSVVRRGGLPTAAPWWTLVVVVIAGILLLTGLDALRAVIVGLALAVSGGPRQMLALAIEWIYQLLKIALFVRVISSWLPISPYSKWIRWSYVLTEWLMRPLRRIVPPLAMFDVTPFVAWGVLWLAEQLLLRLVYG